MNKNKEIFIQYLYSNGMFMSELMPLNFILAEFDSYKKEAYEMWIDNDDEEIPQELFRITDLIYDKDMNISLIQFSER